MNKPTFETVTLKGDIPEKLTAVGINVDKCRTMLQIKGLSESDFEGLRDQVVELASSVLNMIDSQYAIQTMEEPFVYEGETYDTNGTGYGVEYHAEMVDTIVEACISTAVQGRAFKRTVAKNAGADLSVFEATPKGSTATKKTAPSPF